MKRSKNSRQQLIKGYKTPSPSNLGDHKLGRPNQNEFNLLNHYYDKRINQQHKKNMNNKKDQQLKIFNTYLIQNQFANLNQHPNNNSGKNIRQGKSDQNLKRVNSDNDLFSSYYNRGQHTRLDQKTVKANQTNENKSRKSSINAEQFSKSPSNKNSYHETIRKLANQVIKLKRDCKIVQERCQKLSQEKKTGIIQNNHLRQELLTFQENASKKQQRLIEQINGLKKIITTNSEQLSLNNYQIYKMKQQIYELNLNKQKLQVKEKCRGKTYSNLQKLKSSTIIQSFNSKSSLETITDCTNCQKNTKNIIQLTNQLQNIKLQLMQKSLSLNQFGKQIQKMQNQLKLLQKPRQIYKKYNWMVDQLNCQIVRLKAQKLNSKYKKLLK